MLQSLLVNSQVVGGEIRITMEGIFDEHANLPQINSLPEIFIDLRGIRYINSGGVKLWVKWLAEQKDWGTITLSYCPAIMVRNFSMVKGFLLPRVSVESFFVPYSGDKSDERKDILFRRGAEFKDDGSIFKPKVRDADGNPMEMDVIESSYFRFLKK